MSHEEIVYINLTYICLARVFVSFKKGKISGILYSCNKRCKLFTSARTFSALGCYNCETGINDEFNQLRTLSFNLHETNVRIDFEENMSTPLETKQIGPKDANTRGQMWFLSLNG